MEPLFPATAPPKDSGALFPPQRSKSKPENLLSGEVDTWSIIRDELLQSQGRDEDLTWFAELEVVQKEIDQVELHTPLAESEKKCAEIQKRLSECKKRLGLDFVKTKVLSPRKAEKKKEKHPPTSGSNTETQGSVFSKSLAKTPNLNPGYTFESFVRGPSNQFALATCQNIAENPGKNYNPLFLYGSTGLGKTHLLHAVGNMVLSSNKNMVVTYISSERFMNEMIYCIRHNKMWDFRQKYRHCDVFLMDDIQFISGNKSATQEEFFHTFNTLYEAKKQIVVTSDLFPQDIPDIEERLRNRFQWGLIADIQPPDTEHRMAILMSKAETLGVTLSPNVAEFIASQAKKNVRQLEGALHRVAAFAALQGRPLDLKLASETFQGMATESSRSLGIETVQKVVAEHFKLKLSDLKSKKRQRALSVPRQIAMFLARHYTHSSYPDIGDRFGGKDHTTVMHAVKKIASQRKNDASLQHHIESLERQLDQMQ